MPSSFRLRHCCRYFTFSPLSPFFIVAIFILVFVLYVGGEIISGITLKDNISQLTHIIGGVCGALLGISMRK